MAHPGYVDEKEPVQKRLRRIEGQVRMMDEDRYCQRPRIRRLQRRSLLLLLG